MKKPNFFIVGAPQHGSIAMCSYLKQHPDIFIILEMKERHFSLGNICFGIRAETGIS